LASDCAGRQFAVAVDDQLHSLPKRSKRNGHFVGSIRLPLALAEAQALADSSAGRLPLALYHEPDVAPIAQGEAFLLPDAGVSVISDIDDTLKHSHVACKRTLLTNTFLREFETIPGMADLFHRWSQAGAAFHYVSSSPWQLYSHLSDHLSSVGFPAGSYHLRAFRLRDHLIRRLLMLRRSGKASVIRNIVRMFPQRQFVLVGDSGEADPEIYGAVARKYPRQVAGIYIRQLEGSQKAARYQRAFRGIPYDSVRLYRDSSELDDIELPPT
jgi:phosphatidate phosphatase APP1